jgi:hypothetical protein
MTWNYRIVKKVHPNGELTFGIHEAYYASRRTNRANAITMDPIDPHGDDLKELKANFKAMAKAFDWPVLDFDGPWPEPKKTAKKMAR